LCLDANGLTDKYYYSVAFLYQKATDFDVIHLQ